MDNKVLNAVANVMKADTSKKYTVCGYADNYTRALPILKEFGAKAGISLITDAIGTDPLFLSWTQCRELTESGLIELGSHTAALHDWPGLGRRDGEGQADYIARVEPDLRRSVETIRRETGQEVTFFAHPLGVVEEWAQPTLDQLFPVTFTSEIASTDFADGFHRLPRININENNLIDWVVK